MGKTSKEKAEAIIANGGMCAGFMCGSSDNGDECPAHEVCTSTEDNGENRRRSIVACREFLGLPVDTLPAPQPVKTLLDEYAIAAMCALVAKYPAEKLFPNEALEKQDGLALGAYEYAAAMMREKMRRDEMGNVKEVEK